MDAARNVTPMYADNATTTHADNTTITRVGLWNVLLPAVLLKTARELGIYTRLWTLIASPVFQHSGQHFQYS
jgi:hypothetical protein